MIISTNSNSISTHVCTLDANNKLRKSDVWVYKDNFYGVDEEPNDAFLVIGFDTEFKSPSGAVTRDDIKGGNAKYEVLSYQVWCKLYDESQPDAKEWGGVCYPTAKGERLTLEQVVTFALWKGINSKSANRFPNTIYLVGHFTRADIPAFADFKSLTEFMSSVRNTFLTIEKHIPIEFKFLDDEPTTLSIIIRDTMLLTPATSKSLATLGDIVGQPKIVLDPDPAKELHYKRNMDELLVANPTLFERYALNDAEICVRYVEQMIDLHHELTGKLKIPVTLTGIGVELAFNSWNDARIDPNAVLGKENVKQKIYSVRKGHYFTNTVAVDLELVDLYGPLASECYHGGRNEQFWFGPSRIDDWTDYDLSGAYPTAMALIRLPDWKKARFTTNIHDFGIDTLGYASVEFEFRRGIRYPTLPVRTENGLIFPRKGVSNCAAPEIVLAKILGAKLKIRHGVVVPYVNDTPVFANFIRDCTEKRLEQPKGSLKAQFWKEIANSTYGKTAQGLREKRVYDMKEQGTKRLPPSKLTNAFFAAFITSFVRATLGEIMNALPDDATVFSCTTDGFLTNATQAEISIATTGPLSTLYGDTRKALTGEISLLETKHFCRQLLGWRTRGQATLLAGMNNADDKLNIVLAKAGIYTASYMDDARSQNDYIVDLFLNRTPASSLRVLSMTGIRDMIEHDVDLVEAETTKRLNMEFDWKRRPAAVFMSQSPDHLSFSTSPWETVEEFQSIRLWWEELAGDTHFCMKTVEDYRRFADHVLTRSCLGVVDSRYLKKDQPDINRLRQVLGSAWRHSDAGLVREKGGLTNAQFAEVLTNAGIPCSQTDVENGGRKAFEPHRCPPTPSVRRAIKKLRKSFPTIDTAMLLASAASAIDLSNAILKTAATGAAATLNSDRTVDQMGDRSPDTDWKSAA